MSEEYTLKLETRALGAAQIMNGMIYSMLGFLCHELFVEEQNGKDAGYIPVIVILTYIFLSSPIFIMSGSLSIEAQKRPTKFKLIFSMVVNIISACFSALGIIILTIASLTYQPDTNEYVWSQEEDTKIIMVCETDMMNDIYSMLRSTGPKRTLSTHHSPAEDPSLSEFSDCT
uniref:Uncharacterized protein n=1 Tax=Suricata suricatta TaxID=37032 RepID=A0A673UCJ2_SURSU